MAYVPSFEHDVFISYAQADNAGARRISAFHAELVAGIQSRLGKPAFHKPDEWVFFDQLGLKRGDEVTPKLEWCARRSAVMIALVSQSYVQSRYCAKEAQWFLEAKELARDKIERRLIPVIVNPTESSEIQQRPHLSSRLYGNLTGHNPGTAGWNTFLEKLVQEITDHLKAARRQHGCVFLGQTYRAGEEFRNSLMGELRGFRCIPESVVTDPDAVKQALAEAKLAVHFLGDEDEQPDSLEALEWSLEFCRGKTLGLLPPGRSLAEDEKGLIESIRGQGGTRWTQPQGTVVELADIIRGELEAYQLPDPATPIGLACDEPDLETARAIAWEIHQQERGAYSVETPDFLANPKAQRFSEWKKFRTRRQGLVVYWLKGARQRLLQSVPDRPQPSSLGKAWYVSLAHPDAAEKRGWLPMDRETEKILDEESTFGYERLRDFLDRVRRKAAEQ